MKKKDFLIIIDNGHGEDTPDKRSPEWGDQPQLLEWEWNRELATYLSSKLEALGIPYKTLVPELYDVCLTTRAMRANILFKQYPNAILVSLHGNAYGVESVEGFEVFTSPGITESDYIAQEVLDVVKDSKRFKMRLNNREKLESKEARFAILTRTTGNAILVEAGFYTNKKECAYMQSIKGLNEISSMIVLGLDNFINKKIQENEVD